MTELVQGRYRILEKIGEGGMGVVYKAEDITLRRTVALKFLPPLWKTDEMRRLRFIREAQAASSLDHPNICTIYAIGESEEGGLFIAMAYYDGESVKDLIGRGPLPLPQALEIAIQTAKGLAKSHSVELMHRDIKPANLMWTKDEIVKILDFGLARRLDDTRLTQDGRAVGTLAYISPEQLAGQNYDARTDIWALGVVLYEMLTGRLPFSDIHTTLTEPHAPIRRVRPDAPLALEQIVDKALQKRAQDRYQRLSDMLADLQEHKEGRTAPSGWQRKTAAGAPQPLPAIAVLPFENLSPEKENEYFSDGLTEELIMALAKVPGLRVVSRSSVFEFKGKAQNIQRTGALLKVSSVLEGSVRKVGDRVRITAQLTNVADGYQVWSERYDRKMEDVLAIQDDIARAIVGKIRGELSTQASQGLIRRYTDNTEAYHLYLKGKYHWNQLTPEGFQKAIQYFEQALAEDPAYCMPYCGIADYYAMLAFWSLLSPGDAWPKARAAALKALEFDDSVAEAHTSLAYVRVLYDWDFAGAAAGFRRAMELQPSSTLARQGYAMCLMQTGYRAEALALVVEARNLDPVSLFSNTFVAWFYYYSRQYDRAIDECRKVLELEPEFFEAYVALGLAYEQRGMYEEATRSFETAATHSRSNPLVLGVLGANYARTARKHEALNILEKLTELSKHRYVAPVSFAMLYTGLGDNDRALEWLEKAYEVRDGLLGYLGVFPIYAPLHSNPRFAALLDKIGIPREILTAQGTVIKI